MPGDTPENSIPDYIAHRRASDGNCQSLETHLIGVAELAGKHAAKIGLAEHGEMLGLVHDLGKYSTAFQTYLQSAVKLLNPDEDEEFVDAKGLKGKIDHSTAGAQLIWRELSKQGPLGQVVGQILALCVASHHSGLIDCISSDSKNFGEDNFGRRMDKPDKSVHLEEAISKADASVLSRFKELIESPKIISQLRHSISDITASSPVKDDKSIIIQQQVGLLVRMLFSCLIDADRTNTADYEKPKAAKARACGDYIEWDVLIARLEARLTNLPKKHRIDKLRSDISRHCQDAAGRDKGIYTLTVPTGGGKTLASLRFALHHAKKKTMDRIIYVIPFTSIIDQNAEAVRQILEPNSDIKNRGRVVLLPFHSNFGHFTALPRGSL